MKSLKQLVSIINSEFIASIRWWRDGRGDAVNGGGRGERIEGEDDGRGAKEDEKYYLLGEKLVGLSRKSERGDWKRRNIW